MRLVLLILLAAACFWIYNNIDFVNLNTNTTQTLKQEKTMKKFFSADEMNKQRTKEVLEEY